jgi:excinuclease ABC subunit A
MGPEGGFRGGTVVAEGTPEDVAKVTESYTGQFLAEILATNRAAVASERKSSPKKTAAAKKK